MSSVTQSEDLMVPKKVVHFVSVDKQNYYLENLFDYCDRSKLEFLIIAFTEENTQFLTRMKERGIKCYAMGSISHLRIPYTLLSTIKLIREIKPDVIHTHLFNPTMIGVIVGKLLGIPVYVTRHHSDAVHKISSIWKRRLYLTIEACINSAAKLIIAPARGVYNILIINEKVKPEKIEIIPYGQRPERFANIKSETIERIRNEFQIGNKLMIICVSRLYKMKGHTYLLQALAKINQDLPFKLILVGDGDFRPYIEKEAERLNLTDEISFAGWREDVLDIIASADLIVHPSLEDALSSALIESLMLGKPIVATDISGAGDTLCDGTFGVLVKPADAEALKTGIETVINDLPAAIEKAKKGREWILDYMDAERVAKEHERIYFLTDNL